MSNLSPANPLGPLTVGNVINAGVRIYRSHLQQYLTLTLRAFLWILVPVYGWAKCAELTATISRLAYSELINQPETVSEARKHTKPRQWKFLGAAILVTLIFIGLYMGIGIVLALLTGITAALAFVNPIFGVILGLLGVAVLIAVIVFLIRFYSRLAIVEVPLAIEENLDATEAIGRSWDLTKGSVGRIQWIVVVAFLLTLLVIIPSQLIISLLEGVLGGAENATPTIAAVLALANLGLSIVGEALVTPFWQIIKAVIYYDLRTRREGLGLQLRNR